MNAYVHEYRKIERRTRRRESFALRYLPILLLLLGAVVVLKIYTQSVSIAWSQHLVELNETVRDMEVRNGELQREIASLSGGERVAQRAEERLGMIVPDEDDIVLLPVLDRAAAHVPDERENRDERLADVVRGWLDALWQEEAFALTSR